LPEYREAGDRKLIPLPPLQLVADMFGEGISLHVALLHDASPDLPSSISPIAVFLFSPGATALRYWYMAVLLHTVPRSLSGRWGAAARGSHHFPDRLLACRVIVADDKQAAAMREAKAGPSERCCVGPRAQAPTTSAGLLSLTATRTSA